MIKVTMPDPVAHAITAANTGLWVKVILAVDAGHSGIDQMHSDLVHDLITTEQAEEYAAAKVREALEEAIAAVESCRTTGTIRHGTVSDCIEAIRALLPSTPARPESEQ